MRIALEGGKSREFDTAGSRGGGGQEGGSLKIESEHFVFPSWLIGAFDFLPESSFHTLLKYM